MSSPGHGMGARVAYFWGDDDRASEVAIAAFAREVAEASGEQADALERWRVTGDTTSAAAIGERVATAPLFGAGVVVIVRDPAPLVRSKAESEALLEVLPLVAPGNALAFVETLDGSGRRAAALDTLRDAVANAGGVVRRLAAPTRDQMATWIGDRARERGIRLGRGAAATLAERIGAYVREGDVDRRFQSGLALSELDKLALFRSEDEITPDDVRALVADAVPGSTWAFLDAVAERRAKEAAVIGERLLDTVPPPLLVAQLHRRLRDLLEVAELLAGGASPGSLVRTLKVKPFRAEKLASQARAWSPEELQAALEGLLELDAAGKGVEGLPGGEPRRRLAFTLWLAERVARTGQASGVGRARSE